MRGRKIITKSKIVKNLGGTRAIKALPLAERLRMYAKISRELRRPKAARKCAMRSIEQDMEDGNYLRAAKTAKENKLNKLMRQASKKAIHAYQLHSAECFQLAAIKTAKEFGNRRELKSAALEFIESSYEPWAWEQGSMHFGDGRRKLRDCNLNDAEIDQAARTVIKRAMEEKKFKKAMELALAYDLVSEQQDAAKKIIEAEIWDCNKVNKLTKKYGLGWHVKGIAEREWNKAMKEKRYRDALYLAQAYLGDYYARQPARHIVKEEVAKGEDLKGAKLAERVGLEKMAEKIRKNHFNRLMTEGKYLEAAEFAKDSGFITKMREAGALHLQQERDRGIHGYHFLRDAIRFGLVRRFRSLATEVVQEHITRGDHFIAEEIAGPFGLKKQLLAVEKLR